MTAAVRTRRVSVVATAVCLAAMVVAACGSSASGTATSAPATAPQSTATGTTVNVPLSTIAVTSTSSTTTTSTIPAVKGLDLSNGGIGGALFGADPESVLRYARSILGSPTADTGWVDTATLAGMKCAGTQARFVTFHDLQLFFSDDTGYSHGRQHFAAYVYGPASGDHIDPYGLTTATGIHIGSTVAELKKAYPKVGLNQPSQARPYPGFSIRHNFVGALTGLLNTDTVTAVIGGAACTK